MGNLKVDFSEISESMNKKLLTYLVPKFIRLKPQMIDSLKTFLYVRLNA